MDIAWMGGSAGLDLAATRYALARCPGCYEAHPLMRSSAGAAAMKVGATALGGWACYELRKRGHEREAKWFRWTVVAIWSGVAVNAMVRAR